MSAIAPPRGATIAIRDILGNSEVRKLAGRQLEQRNPITRHTLIAWRRDRGFPAPIRILESGELWDRGQVLVWLKQHRDEQP